MCTFQDNLESFNALNAKVLGISVDSPFSNNAFASKYNLDLLTGGIVKWRVVPF